MCVVANDSLTCVLFCKSVRPDGCHASLVVAFEHNARPAHLCVFQHIICFFARVIQLSTPLDRAAQEVMQTDSWEADRVFQDVDAFFGVECSHLFQSLHTWRHVQVVMITMPVREGFHPLFFKDLLAFFDLLELQNETPLQL